MNGKTFLEVARVVGLHRSGDGLEPGFDWPEAGELNGLIALEEAFNLLVLGDFPLDLVVAADTLHRNNLVHELQVLLLNPPPLPPLERPPLLSVALGLPAGVAFPVPDLPEPLVEVLVALVDLGLSAAVVRVQRV